MAIDWVQTALNAAIFAGILSSFGYLAVKWARPRVQMWIGGAIGNFMTNLANEAAEEGSEGSSPGAGVLNLGGFKIDVNTIGQLLQLAKQFGLGDILKKGGSGGGGGW